MNQSDLVQILALPFPWMCMKMTPTARVYSKDKGYDVQKREHQI